MSRRFQYIVIILNREFKLYCAERRIISYSTELHWCSQSYIHNSGCGVAQEKGNLWLLGCRREQKSVRSVGRVSQDLLYWTKLLQKDFSNPEERWTKISNDITSRSHMAGRLDKNWKSRSKKKERRMGNRETKTRIWQKFEENLFFWSDWWRIWRHHL